MNAINVNTMSKKIIQILSALLLIAVAATGQASVESTTYILTDHLGSPILATDENGDVKWREDYQPFGTQIINEDGNNAAGFTGHLDDKTLNVTYMQGRWYHPEMGRFMAIDPVGFVEESPGSFNRYAYVSNNPFKFVDPDGEWQITAAQGPPAPFGSGEEGMNKAIQAQKANTEGLLIGGLIGASITLPPVGAFLTFDGITKGEMPIIGIPTKVGTMNVTKGAKPGEFNIVDWKGYPDGVPKPTGPVRLVEGAEYEAARKAANSANSKIRRDNNLTGQAVDVHEVQPVKFGGSPTDPANKVILDRSLHRQEVTPWWNELQKDVGG